MGVHKQFAGGTQNFKSYQKIPHKGSKRVLGGMQRESILIWGYAKGVNFGFWGTQEGFSVLIWGYVSNKRLTPPSSMLIYQS